MAQVKTSTNTNTNTNKELSGLFSGFGGLASLRAGLVDQSVGWKKNDFVSLHDLSEALHIEMWVLEKKLRKFRKENGLDQIKAFRIQHLYSRDDNPSFMTLTEATAFWLFLAKELVLYTFFNNPPKDLLEPGAVMNQYEMKRGIDFILSVFTSGYRDLDALLQQTQEQITKDALGQKFPTLDSFPGDDDPEQDNPGPCGDPSKRLYTAEELAVFENVRVADMRISLLRFSANLHRDEPGRIGPVDSNGIPKLDRQEAMAFLYWRLRRGVLPSMLNVRSPSCGQARGGENVQP